MRRLALFLAMWLPINGALSGCSWIFVQPPPRSQRSVEHPDCTTSQTLPEVDALLALTTVGGTVVLMAQDNFKSADRDGVVAFILVSGLVASAVYGFRVTSDCAKTRQDDDPVPGLGARSAPAAAPNARQPDPE